MYFDKENRTNFNVDWQWNSPCLYVCVCVCVCLCRKTAGCVTAPGRKTMRAAVAVMLKAKTGPEGGGAGQRLTTFLTCSSSSQQRPRVTFPFHASPFFVFQRDFRSMNRLNYPGFHSCRRTTSKPWGWIFWYNLNHLPWSHTTYVFCFIWIKDAVPLKHKWVQCVQGLRL